MIRREALREDLASKRANIGNSLFELPGRNRDVPGLAERATRWRAVHVSYASVAKELPKAFLPILRAEIEAKERHLREMTVSFPINRLDCETLPVQRVAESGSSTANFEGDRLLVL